MTTPTQALTLARRFVDLVEINFERSTVMDDDREAALAAIDAHLASQPAARVCPLCGAPVAECSGTHVCDGCKSSSSASQSVLDGHLIAADKLSSSDVQPAEGGRRPGVATGKDAGVYASIAANYWKGAEPAEVGALEAVASYFKEKCSCSNSASMCFVACEAHDRLVDVEMAQAQLDRKSEAIQKLWRERDAAMAQVAALTAKVAELERDAAAWRELTRRVYVELFHCDRQMTSERKKWQQGPSVRDALRDAKFALDAADALDAARHDSGGAR